MFTFKHFTINDEHCAMKVGTDGVLLGAWADVDGCRNVLDIGCGSGLISLMLAQRAAGAHVEGVEIDKSAAEDAQQNVTASSRAEQIKITCADVCDFAKHNTRCFDCIVTNPPYHEEELLPPDASRARARHTDGGLSFAALLHVVNEMLSNQNGARFCLILPAPASPKFAALAAAYGLFETKRLNVVTSVGKPCKRVLIEFRRNPVSAPAAEELTLCDKGGKRTEAYATLCQDFYL